MAAKKKVRRRPRAPGRGYEVITLRIRPEHKERLVAHCKQRERAENRRYVSFNQAIIDLIQAAPA